MNHIRVFSIALCFVFVFSACNTPAYVEDDTETQPVVETETESDIEQDEPDTGLEAESEPEVEIELESEPEVVPEPEEEETVAQAAEVALAQCLTEKGATLYTASWCGHCQSQKAAFGEGIQYLDNVECAAFGGWSQECEEAGVEAVPTWIFGDGTEKLGNTPLETLAALNNCEY
ncbi:hypothetical protein GF369_03490 [Candidatus Peregrinibacteria bacterium]|nr:hypothetical protein [Candidatus Peregrinibacteria bacterium]